MKIALMIIDVQKAYIGHRKDEKLYDETFWYINYTAGLFRKADKPVIVVRDIANGDGPDYDNVADLTVAPTDHEILKNYGNSFWKTNLEGLLKDLDVDFVMLCGNAEEFCVSATYNGAIERDFGVAILQNGVFSETEVGSLDMMRNKNLVAYNILKGILEG